jgi:hypothetical protein
MDKNMEYALMVFLVMVIVYALWYFFIRKKKCKTSSDCKSNQVCSGGYCKGS